MPLRLGLCGNQIYGAFVLNRRVDLHAIDATPARWRGDDGSSPLDGAPDTLVDFHTGVDYTGLDFCALAGVEADASCGYGTATSCVETNQCVGCTMRWPRWLRRVVRNRHRHAIEQASVSYTHLTLPTKA